MLLKQSEQMCHQLYWAVVLSAIDDSDDDDDDNNNKEEKDEEVEDGNASDEGDGNGEDD